MSHAQDAIPAAAPSATTHTVMRKRRRVLRALLRRDTSPCARRWPGKLLIVVVLLLVPSFMLFGSMRAGRYTDKSWEAVLMATLLALGYLTTRRLLLTVAVAALSLVVVAAVMAPDLAASRNGDAALLAQLDHERGIGAMDGMHDVAVAQIDIDAPRPVRLAGVGADANTRMEVGSITKAMTGLVIADAVERGEVRMNVPVSTYLPQLAGSRAGTVTLHELVTHTAGYADFGTATMRRAAWTSPFGRNFIDTDLKTMTEEVRGDQLATRGSWAYSSLGASVAGQAVAAATGMTYSELMRTRLFDPLGMSHTAIQTDHPLVAGGTSRTGLPSQPWSFDAYAPAGGVVSTTSDLGKLAAALLRGSAPGMRALDPTEPTGRDDTRVGDFWVSTAETPGHTITWHTGQTGGYTSYIGLDRAHHRATVVLADVATPATADLGIDLVAAPADPSRWRR
jgi:CubicO group peptidase (beta-lactamase class C family)